MDNNFIRTLEQVDRAWEEFNRERESFLANVERWRVCRSKTLSALQKLLDEFHRISRYECYYSNTVKVVPPPWILATPVDWIEFGKTLMNYGPVAGGGGDSVIICAALVEAGISEHILSEVKAALEEDGRQTNELFPWFKRAQKVDGQLREVYDCDFANIRKISVAEREISNIVSDYKALDNLRSYLSNVTEEFSLDNIPSKNTRRLEEICNVTDKVKMLFREFCDHLEVQEEGTRLRFYFRHYRLDSSYIISVSIRIIQRAVVRNEQFLNTLLLTERQNFQCTHIVLQGIFCASNVFDLLASLKDVKNGTSKYCERVQNIRNYLSEEYNDLVESFSTLEIAPEYG